MRKLLPLAALVLSTSCVAVGVNNSVARPYPPSVGETELLQADRDFADATHKRGIEGWMSFFADDAIRIKYRGGMVKGYGAIRAADTPLISDTTITLNWQPLEAYVFKRGTAGITIGTSQIVNRTGPKKGEITYRGRYTTLWRREPDGRWRVIMDTGYPDAGS
jgi:ketosteroid isomerase-like protein